VQGEGLGSQPPGGKADGDGVRHTPFADEGVGPGSGERQAGQSPTRVAVEDGLLPAGVRALQQSAEAVGRGGSGEVGQGQRCLGLWVRVGAFFLHS